MALKSKKSFDRLEPGEKGEAAIVARAEAGRRLREAPDYIPNRAELKEGGSDSQETEREIEKRIDEAEKVWQECGECRSDFAREFGIDTHAHIEEKIRQDELARGREEGPETFEIERTIIDPQGNEHRPDFWDHEARAIDDIKPVHKGETVGELFEKHKDQLLRYVRVVKETKGEEIKEVGIRPYPGIEEDVDG